MSARSLSIFIVLCLTPLGALPACGGGGMRAPQPGESRHGAYDLPAFDLQACFPRSDRDWGGDAKLQAMWVAVGDAFPRLAECRYTAAFLTGASNTSLELTLRVQPDHSVKVEYTTPSQDASYRACVDEALAMIDLPHSSEPSGQQYSGSWAAGEMNTTLAVDGSKLGTIIGRVRTDTMSTCGCLERYRDQVPDDVKFKFDMTGGTPYVQNIKYVGDPDSADKELVMCLAEHLASVEIADFGGDLSASYRYKFENSRAFDVARLVSDGDEAHNRGDLDTARSLYDRALSREPNHVDALLGLAHIELDLERPREALTYLERARDEESDNALVLYDIGRAHAQLEAPREALDWYEDSLAIREDFRTLTAAASAWLELDDAGEARELAGRARALQPSFAIAYTVEARALHHLGDSDEALGLLDQATRLDLEDVSSWNAILVVYLDLERPEQAAAVATRARERGFDAAILRYHEGVALQRLQESAAASEAFCEAARLEPGQSTYTDACSESR